MEPRTKAAVLVPVFRAEDGELRVVLVVRGDRGLHAGQLGLPGGRPEPGDACLLETALREAQEEIGLARADVEVVAELDALDTRTTGYRVHPFLARVRGPRAWQLAEGEIVGVVTPPVRSFADPAARRVERFSLPHWSEPRDVESVEVEDGRLVWGFTLRLLDAVAPRLLAGEWAL